jgi:hypothetical protein
VLESGPAVDGGILGHAGLGASEEEKARSGTARLIADYRQRVTPLEVE